MVEHTASLVRAAALRSRCLSLAKTCSIGLRSGEYFGSRKSFAPAFRIALLLRGRSLEDPGVHQSVRDGQHDRTDKKADQPKGQ